MKHFFNFQGAPQKIAYLAEELFRDLDIRYNVKVSFFSGMGKIFAVDKYAAELIKVCEKRQINVNLLHDLVEVDHHRQVAIFKKLGPSGGDLVEVKYDMLHVTPPMGPPTWIASTGLQNEAGWIDVKPDTLQHKKFDNVFALGDASSLPTSKTAAAAQVQSGIVVDNLSALIRHKELTGTYDGYTSCPLITGKGKLIMAEFDYKLTPLEVVLILVIRFKKLIVRHSLWIKEKRDRACIILLPKFCQLCIGKLE